MSHGVVLLLLLLLLLVVLMTSVLWWTHIQFWFLRHGDFVWKVCRDI